MMLKEKIEDAVVPNPFYAKLTRIAELLGISKGELIQDLSTYSLKQELLRIYRSRREKLKGIDLMEKRFKNKFLKLSLNI